MKKFIGKNILFHVVEMGKFKAFLKSVDGENGELVVKSGNDTFHLMKDKIISYKPTDKTEADYDLYIYMCKNDELNCKGSKHLSTREDKTIKCMNCPCLTDDLNCDFERIGKLSELPIEIRTAFLEGMSTKLNIPNKIEKDKNE